MQVQLPMFGTDSKKHSVPMTSLKINLSFINIYSFFNKLNKEIVKELYDHLRKCASQFKTILKGMR